MYYTSEGAGIIEPVCRRLSGKSLYTAEGRILSRHALISLYALGITRPTRLDDHCGGHS